MPFYGHGGKGTNFSLPSQRKEQKNNTKRKNIAKYSKGGYLLAPNCEPNSSFAPSRPMADEPSAAIALFPSFTYRPYLPRLCFSFRMRRTLSSIRFSVISPASTALTTASKAFVFKFISVPAKWIRTARHCQLNIYTDNKSYQNLFAFTDG